MVAYGAKPFPNRQAELDAPAVRLCDLLCIDAAAGRSAVGKQLEWRQLALSARDDDLREATDTWRGQMRGGGELPSP